MSASSLINVLHRYIQTIQSFVLIDWFCLSPESNQLESTRKSILTKIWWKTIKINNKDVEEMESETNPKTHNYTHANAYTNRRERMSRLICYFSVEFDASRAQFTRLDICRSNLLSLCSSFLLFFFFLRLKIRPNLHFFPFGKTITYAYFDHCH